MRVGLFHRFSEFRREERGNDLLDLALVIAFVLLGSTALFIVGATMSTASCNIRAGR